MKNKISLSQARRIAESVVAELACACERIEIAGSVRREKSEVGDIEICAIPKIEKNVDLFGFPIEGCSALDIFEYAKIGRFVKGKSRYKQILLPDGISLDLFICLPPVQWGVVFTIRTGDADFSHKIVTPRKHGGFLPSDCKVKDGTVYRNDDPILMPEEEDFLKLLGFPGLSPQARTNFVIK